MNMRIIDAQTTTAAIGKVAEPVNPATQAKSQRVPSARRPKVTAAKPAVTNSSMGVAAGTSLSPQEL
jgi:hypothetical protein